MGETAPQHQDEQTESENNSSAAAAIPAPVISDNHEPQQDHNARPEHQATIRPSKSFVQRGYDLLSWTPPASRWDPKSPPHLTLPLNLLFGFACTFTVANLYYNHPLLDILATSFDVSQERVSIIPTVAQAGYAVGLLFLCPLGDLVKRRPFVLLLAWFTATVWLGLCITTSFGAFVALTFVSSVTTVTPQLMLPLVGELAPPHRRATAISIVVSGLLFGILVARLISGIIAAYSSWRNVYWMAFGLQYAIVLLLWLFMPDYPATNTNIPYFRILWSILELVVKEPLLVQSCLMAFFVSSTFTSFWTTLTFLLSGSPYHYSTTIIGLFALGGIIPMLVGPFIARMFIDRFNTHTSVLIGETVCLIGIVLGTYTGSFAVAGPILEAIWLDLGQQMTQIANRTAIYGVNPKASNRVNTAYMVSVFGGQLMGSAVGNRLYAQGGWVRSGSANVSFIGVAIVFCLLRGPHETGWVGWRGGIDLFGRRGRGRDQQMESVEGGNDNIHVGVDGSADVEKGGAAANDIAAVVDSNQKERNRDGRDGIQLSSPSRSADDGNGHDIDIEKRKDS